MGRIKYQDVYHKPRRIKMACKPIVLPVPAFDPGCEAQPCGQDYDSEACPLRYRSGVLKQCRECKIFKGGTMLNAEQTLAACRLYCKGFDRLTIKEKQLLYDSCCAWQEAIAAIKAAE
jgi:hypothetical protein